MDELILLLVLTFAMIVALFPMIYLLCPHECRDKDYNSITRTKCACGKHWPGATVKEVEDAEENR